MNRFVTFLLLMLTLACASNERGPGNSDRTYSYADVTGSYKIRREVKLIKNKLVTRNQLVQSSGGNQRVLEKSVTVSQLGTVNKQGKRAMVVRPYASEFTVWLEGKKYHSRLQLLPEKKSMSLTLESPERKWQGRSLIPVPKGQRFCFYSQIPDCLYHNQLLKLASSQKSQSFGFYVVWDNYPYVQEILTGVGKNLFSAATIKHDGEIKGRIRYIIEVEGQVILYQFSKNYDFEKMAWISQGITLVPPGEEETSIDNQ